MRTQQPTEQYKVISNTREAPGVSTLALELARNGGGANGGIPPFTAGQFITVYFPDTGTPEGKAYSISSAPHERPMTITVRAIGEFSNRLYAKQSEDVITASLPYGYFGNEGEEDELTLVAAGIGITPFRSIIRDAMKKNPERKISLHYSARNRADLVFKNEFDALGKENKNFAVHYFITRENNGAVDGGDGITSRRMNAGDILKRKKSEFLLCGSISFVRDIWKGLRMGGIPESAIYTEAFFS